jgi:hypothetical protein
LDRGRFPSNAIKSTPRGSQIESTALIEDKAILSTFTASRRMLKSLLPFLLASSAAAASGLRARSLTGASIDFESYSPGDIITSLGPGITVTTWVQPRKKGPLQPGQAMIFNSAAPTGGDEDLGTPNADFGGPGIGKGGKSGMLFPNDRPHGNVLIISEDGNSTNPDDNKFGGVITFDFDPPMDLHSIGLLDNEESATFEVFTSDGGSSVVINENGGDNSWESVRSVAKPSVNKLVVKFAGSGAITDLTFLPPGPCSLLPLDNLNALSPGDVVTTIGSGITVSAQKVDGKKGPLVAAEAMVFDSENPTGEDFDLGTPHRKVGGPGIGKAGKPNQLFPNIAAKGNILIISEDNDSSDPDDTERGGVLTFEFDTPTDLGSIGLLDNDGTSS